VQPVPLYQATLSMVSTKSQASSRSSDPVRRAMPGSQPCTLAGLRWHNVNHARIRGNGIQLE